MEGVSGFLQHVGITQRHPPGLSRSEGEDPGSKEAVACQLDEGRIPALPDDGLIDFPGPAGIHDLSPELLSLLVEREAVEHGIGGQRVEVIRFPQGVTVSLEPLVHHHRGDVPLHFYPHLRLDPLNPGAPKGMDGLNPPLGNDGMGHGPQEKHREKDRGNAPRRRSFET